MAEENGKMFSVLLAAVTGVIGVIDTGSGISDIDVKKLVYVRD